MQRGMIPHRGPEFKHLYREILRMARVAHRTDGDVFTWPASGSAGWEAGIVNLLSPGDTILAVTTGYFGERFAHVGEAFGLDVRRLKVPWGEAATPAELARELEAIPSVRAVFLSHNETSTGITNPLSELAAVARQFGALTLVDAVSSAGGLPLEMDAWDLDYVFSGSQKAWMCPPGLMIAAVGPRAWEATHTSRFPRFFWDFNTARDAANSGMTSSTPSLTLLYAYKAALHSILDEGVETVWERHRLIGERTRQSVRALGLDLLARETVASNTVTAVRCPEGVEASALAAAVREASDIDIATGQAHLAGKIIRIGHMGWVQWPDVEQTLAAIGEVLPGLSRSEISVDRAQPAAVYR
ncbi:MAG: alanine--glyoxylate aminotransferase family protein [Chloroflexota bacterium]|nr:alanine--glyoxylate aminotransferase family protein [Chloroflexota bacterium]